MLSNNFKRFLVDFAPLLNHSSQSLVSNQSAAEGGVFGTELTHVYSSHLAIAANTSRPFLIALCDM